jgi:hypothetical protein
MAARAVYGRRGSCPELKNTPSMKFILTLTALALAASTALAADPAKKSEGKAKRDPEALFKKLDVNADGAVTKEEWEASRAAKKDAERAAKAFTTKDKDADGKLTKEEFTAERKKKK